MGKCKYLSRYLLIKRDKMDTYSSLSEEEALKKIQRYCAYQDRCHQEVRSKLLSMKVYGQALENVMMLLIQERFLDEERFAKSYAGGKFRIKKWGRVRIKQELKKRAISDYCIKKGLEEIEEEEYLETVRLLVAKKKILLKESDEFKKNKKIATFLQNRGYEASIIWEVIKSQSDQL